MVREEVTRYRRGTSGIGVVSEPVDGGGEEETWGEEDIEGKKRKQTHDNPNLACIF